MRGPSPEDRALRATVAVRQFCSTTSIVWCTRRTRLLQCRAQCFLAGSAAEWHPTFPLHKTLGFYFESPSFDAFLLKISLERVIEATRIVEDRAVSSFKWKIESQPAVGRRVVSVPGFKNLEFRIQRSYVNHRDLLDLVSRISYLVSRFSFSAFAYRVLVTRS